MSNPTLDTQDSAVHPILAEKRANRIIAFLSFAVTAAVAVLFFTPAVKMNIDVHALPKVNASLNSGVSLLLLLGFYFVKTGKVRLHRISMMSAFVLSALFLVSYVVYHMGSESTSYGGEGVIRYVYFFILITHVVLAALILPLILLTVARAIGGNLTAHRKLAKWTFPLWLYVSVTGVIVYFMISPYYGA